MKSATEKNAFVFFTAHIKRVMYALVNAERPLTTQDLSQRVNRSGRQIYYDVDQINYILIKAGIEEIHHQDGLYYLTAEQKEQVSALLSKSVRVEEKDNRMMFIICTILVPANRITIEYLQNRLEVSRNTILNDIADIRKLLKEYDLELSFDRKKGYQIKGGEYSQNYIFCYAMSNFSKSSHYAFLDLYDTELLQDTMLLIRQLLDELSVHARQREIIVFAHFFLYLFQKKETHFLHADKIQKLRIYSLVQKYFPMADKTQHLQISLSLLSICSKEDLFSITEIADSIEIAEKLINSFEDTQAIHVKNKKLLKKKLGIYLQFASLCIDNHLPIINISGNDFKKEYTNLFIQVKSCYREQQAIFPFPIYDNEIVTLSMYISPHLPISKVEFCLRICLICNSNEVVIDFLKNEIQSLSEFIQVTEMSYTDMVNDISNDTFDLIVSTMHLTIDYPLLHIATIITLADKQKILQFLAKKLNDSI